MNIKTEARGEIRLEKEGRKTTVLGGRLDVNLKTDCFTGRIWVRNQGRQRAIPPASSPMDIVVVERHQPTTGESSAVMTRQGTTKPNRDHIVHLFVEQLGCDQPAIIAAGVTRDGFKVFQGEVEITTGGSAVVTPGQGAQGSVTVKIT